jgi:hypothetical protein
MVYDEFFQFNVIHAFYSLRKIIVFLMKIIYCVGKDILLLGKDDSPLNIVKINVESVK